ncbi:hypothetical protein BC938DRAFT_478693, partial [Jimgerdemannia flammicorona]
MTHRLHVRSNHQTSPYRGFRTFRRLFSSTQRHLIAQVTYQNAHRFRPSNFTPLSPPLLQERKYFDSGDYALSKAGKADSVGSQHPSPENIPHSNPTTKDNASPTKESSLVHDTTENLGSTPAV